ncbi:methyltransferase type 11 [Moorena producens PAL-8-15-08-1]|uniref:Methyltransferase type 11 n=1 Tax=Moorena producens PAL-8-15-08-1 TaxID=1458985 RepID=A0A1D8TR26_9CYAN|nr:methyltransferase domain-containing protein [Moorena producens]AOX00090.1 methyltransferase type 11 [Moorena producens PAL-8-15-08-1]
MQNVDFEIKIPEIESARNLPIQEEFFWLSQNGKETKLRVHDYSELYRIPDLYRHLIEKLHSISHTVLSSRLIDRVTQAGETVEDLVLLEVGAGSGMVGKALVDLGVKSVTGIDILPEAAEAAAREYPGVYENYYVEDLTNLSHTAREGLNSQSFNGLVCGSALGFNHIPAQGWATAFNAIAPNGWIAFNVQKERWEDKSSASFLAWHPWVGKTDIFEIVETHEYQHRFHLDGRPLYYIAIIGKKRGNIPES